MEDIGVAAMKAFPEDAEKVAKDIEMLKVNPEKVTQDSEDIENEIPMDSKEDVFVAYESSAYNCYITAGIYAAVVAFSGWQVMVNSKLSEYEN